MKNEKLKALSHYNKKMEQEIALFFNPKLNVIIY